MSETRLGLESNSYRYFNKNLGSGAGVKIFFDHVEISQWTFGSFDG
jgi:hypothetical protein